jgi:hypothetical protein
MMSIKRIESVLLSVSVIAVFFIVSITFAQQGGAPAGGPQQK